MSKRKNSFGATLLLNIHSPAHFFYFFFSFRKYCYLDRYLKSRMKEKKTHTLTHSLGQGTSSDNIKPMQSEINLYNNYKISRRGLAVVHSAIAISREAIFRANTKMHSSNSRRQSKQCVYVRFHHIDSDASGTQLIYFFLERKLKEFNLSFYSLSLSLSFEQVTKRRRIVARVQCRNIKNECPKPACDEPIQKPGKCCKVCPGETYAGEYEIRNCFQHLQPAVYLVVWHRMQHKYYSTADSLIHLDHLKSHGTFQFYFQFRPSQDRNQRKNVRSHFTSHKFSSNLLPI